MEFCSQDFEREFSDVVDTSNPMTESYIRVSHWEK